MIQTARGGDDRIRGPVPIGHKRPHMFGPDTVNGLPVSDDADLEIEHGGLQPVTHDIPRHVLIHLELFLNDLALLFPLRRVDQAVTEGISVDRQNLLQDLRRCDKEIARPLGSGVGVDRRPHAFHFLGDLEIGARRRALEHHVLEGVRNPDDLIGFVPAAAPEIDVERHGFGVRAFLGDDADFVAECVRLKVHLGVAHFVRVPAHSR